MLRQSLRIALIALAPVILFLGLHSAGTYSPWRDAMCIVLVTGLFVAFRVRGAGKPANFVAAPTSPGCFRSLSPRLAFGWLLACWVALSTLDVVCQSAPLALNGRVASPVTPIAGDGKLRIGLALSGGGYRAALVHAGVLQELPIAASR